MSPWFWKASLWWANCTLSASKLKLECFWSSPICTVIDLNETSRLRNNWMFWHWHNCKICPVSTQILSSSQTAQVLFHHHHHQEQTPHWGLAVQMRPLQAVRSYARSCHFKCKFNWNCISRRYWYSRWQTLNDWQVDYMKFNKWDTQAEYILFCFEFRWRRLIRFNQKEQ